MPTDTIYYDSLNNLIDVIGLCDEVNIYDNTDLFKEIIYFKNSKILWRDEKIPNWTSNILQR